MHLHDVWTCGTCWVYDNEAQSALILHSHVKPSTVQNVKMRQNGKY